MSVNKRGYFILFLIAIILIVSFRVSAYTSYAGGICLGSYKGAMEAPAPNNYFLFCSQNGNGNPYFGYFRCGLYFDSNSQAVSCGTTSCTANDYCRCGSAYKCITCADLQAACSSAAGFFATASECAAASPVGAGDPVVKCDFSNYGIYGTCNANKDYCKSVVPPCKTDSDCKDTTLCNGDEKCDIQTGNCVVGTPLICDDGNVCNGIEKCDPQVACQPGISPNIDDNDLCTVDSCDARTGIHHTPINVDDNDKCTYDYCDSVTGKHNDPWPVDDGDKCTLDKCDRLTGLITHTPDNSLPGCECGNKIVQADLGEKCDNGPLNGDFSACDSQCQWTKCDDGKTQQPNGIGPDGTPASAFIEDCDYGELNGVLGSGCSASCKFTKCGNDITDPGEECDDGANNGPDKRCNKECHLTRCGDGIKQTIVGEECDDGPEGSSKCTKECKLTYCGDNVVQGPWASSLNHGVNGDGQNEECDLDGNNIDTGICRSDCISAHCGDGIKQTIVGEECDDGGRCLLPGDDTAMPTGPACSKYVKLVCDGTTCTFDDDCAVGACFQVEKDGCDNFCKKEKNFCGDGHIDAGEQCDWGGRCPDGKTFCKIGQFCQNQKTGESTPCQWTDLNKCTKECKRTTCGDGAVQCKNYDGKCESCDDGGVCKDGTSCKIGYPTAGTECFGHGGSYVVKETATCNKKCQAKEQIRGQTRGQRLLGLIYAMQSNIIDFIFNSGDNAALSPPENYTNSDFVTFK